MSVVSITLGEHTDAAAVQQLLEHTEAPFDVAAELARSYARLWVARRTTRTEEPAEVVGFILVWDVVDEAHIIDLVVDPGHRRQGFGRALLETVVLHARSRNTRVLLLEVRESNHPAIQLYERFGFEQVGKRPAYYADGEAALLMRLFLR